MGTSEMKSAVNLPEWEEPPVDGCPCEACQEARSAAKVCIGFGEREGVCENPAGGPPRDNPIWCGECDKLRIAHLSAQFELLGSRFRLSAEESKGEVEVWVSDDA